MIRVEKDILYTKFLLDRKKVLGYDNVYYSTNEDIKTLLDVYDVKGKDVLTVLGSGDQAFHFHAKKAQSVDLYDSNRLTIYYYYLRVWILKYIGDYYPNKDFPSYIEELIKKIKPETKEEQEACEYWQTFILRFSKERVIELFCLGSLYNLKEEPEEKEVLKKNISKSKTSFYNVDLSEEINEDIPKKYDVIYTSNIRNWIERRNKSWNIYSENLYNLLKDNGVVLSANVVTDGPFEDEKRILEENFKYEKLAKKQTKAIFTFKRPGYVYIKK